jgi:hypothetical protein
MKGKSKLQNLWDRMGIENKVEPVSSYVRNINDVGEDDFDKLWKRHIINEQFDRSLFVNIDRLKIVAQGINNLIQV